MAERPKILVVDDQYHMRKIMGIILRNEYDLIFAKNGQEALEQIRTQELDLVLTDFRMPYSERTRIDTNRTKRKTGIVLYLDERLLNDLLRERDYAGAIYVVQKPFQVAAVIRIIRKLLAQRKSGN